MTISQELDIVLKLVLAMVLGGIIGFEREFDKRPAGLRTNILICVGATMFGLIGLYAFPQDQSSLSRIWQNVLTGVGFLGAGAVIKDEHSVHGLTTAAGMWAVAAIGLAVAGGLYVLAISGDLIVFVTLFVLRRAEFRVEHKQ
jgi:putative Mg2+ transporter-C (MgtC) family protein